MFTEEENRRIKGDMAELKARQQLELEKKKEEIETLQREKDKELETVHEKCVSDRCLFSLTFVGSLGSNKRSARKMNKCKR